MGVSQLRNYFRFLLMKFTFLFFLNLFFLTHFLYCKEEIEKIVYVDIEKILEVFLGSTKFEKKLLKIKQDAHQVAKRKKNKIEKLNDKLEKERKLLSDNLIENLLEEINFLEEDLKEYLAEKKKELKERKKKYKEKLLSNIDYYLKKIAKIKNYSLILENNSSFYYVSKDLNITNAVIQFIEKEIQTDRFN